MNVQIFRVPSHTSGCEVARALQKEGLTVRAGVRNHQSYVAVQSDRTDVTALVRALLPVAVPVNLEHLPAPLPQEASLVP